MRFRQHLCEYVIKHGVTRAAKRYHTDRQFVYRQLEKYNGDVRSLALKSRRPHNSPNAHTKEELVTNCNLFSTLKHSSSKPHSFTEQGIAMLSAVLKSDIAVEVSIRIMNSFVETIKFLFSNQQLFPRLDRVDLKQLETDKKLEEVFNYIASNTEVKQKIFFDGQIYDAFSFIVNLIEKAQSKLILIDNYVDVNTLNILCKKNTGVDVLIATSGKGSLTTKDINKLNAQYPRLSVKTTTDFHDRFLIIDDMEGYFIGASIKDAGKKSFAITKIEDGNMFQDLINKVR